MLLKLLMFHFSTQMFSFQKCLHQRVAQKLSHYLFILSTISSKSFFSTVLLPWLKYGCATMSTRDTQKQFSEDQCKLLNVSQKNLHYFCPSCMNSDCKTWVFLYSLNDYLLDSSAMEERGVGEQEGMYSECRNKQYHQTNNIRC